MKSVFLFLLLCVLYACSSRVYHDHANKMIIEIPNKEKQQKKPKKQYLPRYQVYMAELY